MSDFSRSVSWLHFLIGSLVFTIAVSSSAYSSRLIAQDEDVGPLRQLSVDDVVEDDTVVDFDRDPEGNLIEPDTPISDLYLSLGVKISTTLDGHVPMSHTYRVNAGNSAANRNPMVEETSYLGTTLFEFHDPDDEASPATVNRFSLWVSYVTAKGTKLQAFGADGALLGEIETSINGAEFLGFESEVPIAKVQILPVVPIDPDYAYDTVRFDSPTVIESP